jgi:hypothetical protein
MEDEFLTSIYRVQDDIAILLEGYVHSVQLIGVDLTDFCLPGTDGKYYFQGGAILVPGT